MEVEKKTVDLEKLESLFSSMSPLPWVVCKRQGGIYISTEFGCRDMTDKDIELFIYMFDSTPAIISELKEIIKLRRDVGELRIYSERLEQMLRIRTENNAYLMEQLDKADEEIKRLIEEKWSSFDRERRMKNS